MARMDSTLSSATNGAYMQRSKILAIASCSALMTHSLYLPLTAVWRATYSQRNSLFGGSQVAASLSPLSLLVAPCVASRFSGSLAVPCAAQR